MTNITVSGALEYAALFSVAGRHGRWHGSLGPVSATSRPCNCLYGVLPGGQAIAMPPNSVISFHRFILERKRTARIPTLSLQSIALLHRNAQTGAMSLTGPNAGMRLAHSACLFCHLKLPKLSRCQSIPSKLLRASSQRVEPFNIERDAALFSLPPPMTSHSHGGGGQTQLIRPLKSPLPVS